MSIDPTSVFDRPIAFQRVFVSFGVGITGALFLSQACYWSKRTRDGSGWFYKTAKEWEEETGLTRREQETARAKLRDKGILHEVRKGVPCKTYYLVDHQELFRLCGLVESSMHESAKLDCTKAPHLHGGMSELSTETTTETTTDIYMSDKSDRSHSEFDSDSGAEEPHHTDQQKVLAPATVPPAQSKPVSAIDTAVNEVFEYWREVMGKSAATKLDAKRRTAIKNRLKDGYGVDYIKTAIVKCSQTPHNMGHNDRKQKYNDIELICRNASNLERFAESDPGAIQRAWQGNEPSASAQTGWHKDLGVF